MVMPTTLSSSSYPLDYIRNPLHSSGRRYVCLSCLRLRNPLPRGRRPTHHSSQLPVAEELLVFFARVGVQEILTDQGTNTTAQLPGLSVGKDVHHPKRPPRMGVVRPPEGKQSSSDQMEPSSPIRFIVQYRAGLANNADGLSRAFADDDPTTSS